MICEGISTKVKTWDEVEVNMARGKIRNVSTGVTLQSVPMPDMALEILSKAAYIPYIKERINKKFHQIAPWPP